VKGTKREFFPCLKPAETSLGSILPKLFEFSLFIGLATFQMDIARAVATENRIRAGADAAMGYPRFGMIDLLRLFGGLLVGVFRSHAAREAETAFLRHELVS
jgi:hypothetical protein